MKKKPKFTLKTETDIKVFLLFLLDNVHYPIDEESLMSMVSENTDEYLMDYEMCLADLVDKTHVLSDEVDGVRYYMISETGRMMSAELYDYLEVDSITNYNWGGCVHLDGDYADVTADYCDKLVSESKKLNVPYYPNISVGWDNNVRFFDFVPDVITNNTPEQFKAACEKVKAFTDKSMSKGIIKAPLITLNSWNEWTETSYLQPDDLYGYGYLEAIKEVFDNN